MSYNDYVTILAIILGPILAVLITRFIDKKELNRKGSSMFFGH